MHSSATALRAFMARENNTRAWAGAMLVCEAFDNLRIIAQVAEGFAKASSKRKR